MSRFFGFFFTLYLIGSIPSAYFAAKILKGKDIRRHGSGNVGATNAFRLLGKSAGVAVFTLDFLKGFLPVLICFRLKIETTAPDTWIWLAAAPVLGHVFTPFLGFKGGKGIATGAGVLLGLQPMLFVCAAGLWLVCFTFTRIVSFSSLVCLTPLPLLSYVLGYPATYLKLLIFLILLLTWTHRENIRRILSGTETKF